MEHPTINDLPNELLEIIFDLLDLDDLKNASLVCKRWSDLAFSGRRMDRVTVVLKCPWNKDMLLSNRKYRHLELSETTEAFATEEDVKKLLQTFNLSSLRLERNYSSHSSLRLILLEVLNLQQLSILSEPFQLNEMIEPLPVLRKLERLEIKYNPPQRALPWHTIAPSLQGLNMYCVSEDQLEQWRLFSGQLKHVYAIFHKENLLSRFCEMTFPLLEELSITSVYGFRSNEVFVREHDLFRRHKFFRRNTSLRRLRLDGLYLSKTMVQDITNHSKKLTSLEIRGSLKAQMYNGEPGSLESLAQLTELKHLRFENLHGYIFLGCEALTSVQSLCMNEIKFGRKGSLGFLKDVFKIAPQVTCLELGSFRVRKRVVHFICNKFTKLTRLQLTYSEEVTSDCFFLFDQLLVHLWYLELDLIATNRLFTSIIPQNKVRYLTLHIPNEYDEDDLLRLPKIFPQLDRFNLIIEGECLRECTVDKLRKLLPMCAIKIYVHLVNNAARRRYCRKWLRSEIMPVWEKEWVW